MPSAFESFPLSSKSAGCALLLDGEFIRWVNMPSILFPKALSELILDPLWLIISLISLFSWLRMLLIVLIVNPTWLHIVHKGAIKALSSALLDSYSACGLHYYIFIKEEKDSIISKSLSISITQKPQEAGFFITFALYYC